MLTPATSENRGTRPAGGAAWAKATTKAAGWVNAISVCWLPIGTNFTRSKETCDSTDSALRLGHGAAHRQCLGRGATISSTSVFHFKNETFECDAEGWSFRKIPRADDPTKKCEEVHCPPALPISSCRRIRTQIRNNSSAKDVAALAVIAFPSPPMACAAAWLAMSRSLPWRAPAELERFCYLANALPTHAFTLFQSRSLRWPTIVSSER